MRLPILSGPLRGGWWLLEARGKVMRVLTGSYEAEQSVLFGELVKPGQTVLDVGAHAGYYTLLASRLVGEGGHVYAFEPDPRNARYLRDHVRINRSRNVTIAELAVSDSEGAGGFVSGNGSGTGRLGPGGDLRVETVSLDGYCGLHGIEPDALKIDVEGGEVDVLAGARRLLERQPVIFLSTHGARRYSDCVEFLGRHGYTCRTIPGTGTSRSAELLCTSGLDRRG